MLIQMVPASKRAKHKPRHKRGGQLVIEFRTWGGCRRGAGRKSRHGRKRMAHLLRPMHHGDHPVHVTLRAARHLPSLRKQIVFVALRRALAKTWREWFRIIHFSVQSDHVHMMVEANDKVALSRGMAGLSIRLARAINRVVGRKGQVFGDRYHARELSTPRETRNAIVYVLSNRRKHAAKTAWATGAAPLTGIDPMSSGYWFDGWKTPPKPGDASWWHESDAVPIRHARTWLARKGWRRHGLIGSDEEPKVAWLSFL